MPWCARCDRYRAPTALHSDGTCPICGSVTEAPAVATAAEERAAADRAIPWHFWLMLATVALYLGWRLVQGMAWMIEQL